MPIGFAPRIAKSRRRGRNSIDPFQIGKPIPYDKHIYQERNLVERFFNKIKHFSPYRHTLREDCDKSFAAMFIPRRRHHPGCGECQQEPNRYGRPTRYTSGTPVIKNLMKLVALFLPLTRGFRNGVDAVEKSQSLEPRTQQSNRRGPLFESTLRPTTGFFESKLRGDTPSKSFFQR